VLRLNKSKGNMFRSVSHTATYFQGCDHGCLYCWAKLMGISHVPKLKQTDEFQVLKIRDAVIFLNSAHDCFAECIPVEWINQMLRWINRQHSSNKFLLQSKNPRRMAGFLDLLLKIKDRVRLGTTLETTGSMEAYSTAIHPAHRAYYLAHFHQKYGFETFLSLEPLMNFNLRKMELWIRAVNPVMIEIGLDNYAGRHKVKLRRLTKKKYRLLRAKLIKMKFNFIEKDSIKVWLNE